MQALLLRLRRNHRRRTRTPRSCKLDRSFCPRAIYSSIRASTCSPSEGVLGLRKSRTPAMMCPLQQHKYRHPSCSIETSKDARLKPSKRRANAMERRICDSVTRRDLNAPVIARTAAPICVTDTVSATCPAALRDLHALRSVPMGSDCAVRLGGPTTVPGTRN